MSSGISDTNPVAEQMLIALLRQARMARRIELAAALISFVIEIAIEHCAVAYSEASALEIDLLFVEQQYGLALIACVLRSCHRQGIKTNETPLHL
jgi:hypothetical protein